MSLRYGSCTYDRTTDKRGPRVCPVVGSPLSLNKHKDTVEHENKYEGQIKFCHLICRWFQWSCSRPWRCWKGSSSGGECSSAGNDQRSCHKAMVLCLYKRLCKHYCSKEWNFKFKVWLWLLPCCFSAWNSNSIWINNPNYAHLAIRFLLSNFGRKRRPDAQVKLQPLFIWERRKWCTLLVYVFHVAFVHFINQFPNSLEKYKFILRN